MSSDLGLNPTTAGTVIRVIMPPLTEERRKDLVRVVKQEAEKARVAIRNIRRDGNKAADQSEKDKTLSEDGRDAAKQEIQELTKKYEGQATDMAKARESEVMEG